MSKTSVVVLVLAAILAMVVGGLEYYLKYEIAVHLLQNVIGG